ncbi:type III-B CRISPR module-associated protein Cmr5 [Thermogemmatispora carboxidivorans]|uniref:type III-B CRISPR module-associated protein Cmr5 n=1 Tax=Thermogemmatispora carboxidivorans TaxID=1382306 RepID=UPI00069CB211|nr:type III-B CRISPR module-associated protein Cmr5 [Thermogemmatispora carboxidivorans]
MIEEKQPIRRLLEQERGRFAWSCIQEIKSLPSAELQAEYRTRALTFNQMVQINGLGATLGFLRAKAIEEKKKKKTADQKASPDQPSAESTQQNQQRQLKSYGYLLKHLTEWMAKRGFIPPIEKKSERWEDETQGDQDKQVNALLLWIIQEASSNDYRRATTECLAFGDWLRRFAEAELEKEESKQSAESGQ